MRLGRVKLAWAVGILIVVALALASWFFVLSPRLSTASDLTAQAEQLQTANLTLRNQVSKAMQLAAKAPQAAAEAQTLFATMPNQAELPTVLEQISGAATSAGIAPVDVSTITTSVPVPVVGADAATGVNVAKMDVGVSARGTRAQILKFLDNLQGLDRALLVKSTSLATTAVDPQAKSNVETMEVGGSMFVLQSQLPDLVAEVQKLLDQAEASGVTTP